MTRHHAHLARLTAGLLLLLTGCGTSSNDEPNDAANEGGSAGSTAAGSGGSAGSTDLAGSGSMAGGDGPSWSSDVHPLLVTSCGGCHAMTSGSGGPPRPGLPGGPGGPEGSGNAPGKFAVDDAQLAFDALVPYVVAGDPEGSKLFIKISEDMPSSGGQRMPPALRQWDDASIKTVHDWIEAGASAD